MNIQHDSVFYGAEFVPLYQYKKWDTHKTYDIQTGTVLHINTAKYPICVIDIDFKHLQDNKKENIRNTLIPLVPKNAIIIKTAHGGLHIYTKHNHFPTKNMYVDIISTGDFSIDLFFASHPNLKSNIVVPPSTVKDSENGPELSYTFIQGNLTATTLPNLEEVIEAFVTVYDFKALIDLLVTIRNPPVEKVKKIQMIPPFVNYHLFEVLVGGLEDVPIKDSQNMIIENELSLKAIFLSLNSLNGVKEITKENVEDLYGLAEKVIKIPPEIFHKRKMDYMNEKSTWSQLMKIVCIHNQEYYAIHVLKLLKIPKGGIRKMREEAGVI